MDITLNNNNLIIKNKISSEAIIKSDLNFDEFKQESFKSKFKKGFIYIFTNIGLVASGKSTASKFLEDQIILEVGIENINYNTISSDKIRMEIDKTMEHEKKTSNEDKYNQKIMKKTKKVFDDEFFDKLKNWKEDKYNFIMLDKNFFVNTLSDLKK